MKTLLEMTVPSGDYQHQYAQQALDLGYTEDDWIYQNALHLKAHTDTLKHSTGYHSAVKDALDLLTPVLSVSYSTSTEAPSHSQSYYFRIRRGSLYAEMDVDSIFLIKKPIPYEPSSKLFMFNPGQRPQVTEYQHCIQISNINVDYDYKTLDLDDDYASDSIMFPLTAMSTFTEILKCFQVK